MKAVMLSIQPRWCEKIAVQEKSLEVRKTKPSIQTPFKCYIYQTKRNWVYKLLAKLSSLKWARAVMAGQGKVIGEFICDHIRIITANDFIVAEDGERAIEGSCLTRQEVKGYAGWRKGVPIWECKDLYGWHISDLVIYDKPKPVSAFCVSGTCDERNCEICPWTNGGIYTDDTHCKVDEGKKPLFKPPQSWYYLEEVWRVDI